MVNARQQSLQGKPVAMHGTPLQDIPTLGENTYQTEWKSISSSILSIIRNCTHTHTHTQGSISTVKTAICKAYISYASLKKHKKGHQEENT